MKEKMLFLSFQGCGFSPSKEDVYDSLNILNMDIYNNAFNSVVPKNGERLFLNNSIKVLNDSSNLFKCLISEDGNDYIVEITFNKNDLNDLDDAQCNCDKFIKTGISCEHIYACLYKNKAESNKLIINDHIIKVKKKLIDFNNKIKCFINENIDLIKKISTLGYSFEAEKLERANNYLDDDFNYKRQKYEIETYNKYHEILGKITFSAAIIIRLKYEIDSCNNSTIKTQLLPKVNDILIEYDSLLNSLDNKINNKDRELLSILNDNSYIIQSYFAIYDIKYKIEKYNGKNNNNINYEEQIAKWYKEITLNNPNIINTYNNICSYRKKINDLIGSSNNVVNKQVNTHISTSSSANKSLSFFDRLKRFLNNINEIKQNNVDDELNKKMNNLDLEDWQKDLVRKGDYDPENFEEEDLEEDDYYYDDME